MTHRGPGVRRAPALAFVGFCGLLIAARPASATIQYRVSLDHPERHLFGVSMTIPVEGREVTVAIPAWSTLYRIEDFAYRVRDVTATCGSLDAVPASAPAAVPVNVRKLDKQTWRISLSGSCQPGDHNRFEIHYETDWDEPGPFNSQLNPSHAFVNLSEILMYVPDQRAEDTSVAFDNLPGGWRTAGELATAGAANTYVALSYDKLVDAPVEAGKFDEFEFNSGGAHFRVVVDSENWNRRALENGLQMITAYELQLMGGPPFDPPRREYTFIFHIGPDGDIDGGGMEHSNSTAISTRSVDSAIPIAAHEFFHAWNVKRIRPQSLEPVDYAKEQYSRALWFAEGVTSAYASYTLVRAGLWTKGQFYGDLASQIADLESRPARQWQSAEQSSLEAWFEKYDGYNTPERSISYYNKGQILGVMLDLAIRDATDNHKSLDDVLRRMNVEYAQQGKFYDDSEGIRAVVEEVAGKSFQDFFRRYVSGTDEIPYNDFLGVAGLQLKSAGARSDGVSPRFNPPYAVVEIDHATDRQRRIRDGLLRGATD
jgi:predicted metalloprotease with PDZ domain